MGTMPRYGSYNPQAPDPVLEARRRQFTDAAAARDRSAAYPHLRPAPARDIPLYTPEMPAPAAPSVAQPSIEDHAQRLMDSQQSSTGLTDESPLVEIAAARQAYRGANPSESQRVLAGHDFRGQQPDWGTDVSQAGLANDEEARQGIFGRYARRMQEIGAEESFRDDPMEQAIKRQQQGMEYERNLPAGATSRVHAWQRTPGDGMDPVESEGVGVRPMGGYTMGEQQQSRSAIELARARLNPKDEAEGALTAGRGHIVEELLGRRPGMNPQQFEQELALTRRIIELLKTGFPREDDPGYTATTLPGNQRPTQ